MSLGRCTAQSLQRLAGAPPRGTCLTALPRTLLWAALCCRVQAFAGTGKTTTIMAMIAALRPTCRSILYVVFNTVNRDEATARLESQGSSHALAR